MKKLLAISLASLCLAACSVGCGSKSSSDSSSSSSVSSEEKAQLASAASSLSKAASSVLMDNEITGVKNTFTGWIEIDSSWAEEMEKSTDRELTADNAKALLNNMRLYFPEIADIKGGGIYIDKSYCDKAYCTLDGKSFGVFPANALGDKKAFESAEECRKALDAFEG